MGHKTETIPVRHLDVGNRNWPQNVRRLLCGACSGQGRAGGSGGSRNWLRHRPRNFLARCQHKGIIVNIGCPDSPDSTSQNWTERNQSQSRARSWSWSWDQAKNGNGNESGMGSGLALNVIYLCEICQTVWKFNTLRMKSKQNELNLH